MLTAEGIIPERTLSLVLGRRIDGWMHEDIDITNFGMKPVCFNLELSIRSDFADLFEVKGKNVTRRGAIRTDWSEDKQELLTTYSHKDFSRALRITASDQHAPMTYAIGRLSFNVELKPGLSWHTSLLYAFADGDHWSLAPKEPVDDYISSEATSAQKMWQDSVLKVETQNQTFATAYAQAIDDMAALRRNLRSQVSAVAQLRGKPKAVRLAMHMDRNEHLLAD
jgi:hypothetical protein